MYTPPFLLRLADFCTPPPTDVLVNYIRKFSLSIVFFMPHTYYRFILSTLVYIPPVFFLVMGRFSFLPQDSGRDS
jgi:hypothetical protein